MEKKKTGKERAVRNRRRKETARIEKKISKRGKDGDIMERKAKIYCFGNRLECTNSLKNKEN